MNVVPILATYIATTVIAALTSLPMASVVWLRHRNRHQREQAAPSVLPTLPAIAPPTAHRTPTKSAGRHPVPAADFGDSGMNDQERRLLRELEAHLDADSPDLASSLRRMSAEPPREPRSPNRWDQSR